MTDANILDWAKRVPELLMDDATWQNQLILQYLSRCPARWAIDIEVGDLAGDLLTPEPVPTYLRYNARLEPEFLTALGLTDLAPRADELREMSDAKNRTDLACIGEIAAARDVLEEHLPCAFDLLMAFKYACFISYCHRARRLPVRLRRLRLRPLPPTRHRPTGTAQGFSELRERRSGCCLPHRLRSGVTRHRGLVGEDVSPGESFARAIEEALDRSDAIVVCWSTSSVHSQWVNAEATEGLRRGVLVPV